jgi:hypothetical protein
VVRAKTGTCLSAYSNEAKAVIGSSGADGGADARADGGADARADVRADTAKD